ncbi:hypothetical protein AIN02nite_22150 [Acetobacter indonesiensis]|uniref:Uncharacterized protein n=1 Tax=Acetobacter indonesiensis TaxID=104101 RepID=A0A6N3T7X6_9PROT|nr:hypothetical protein Abin_081_042 [Acetobacter indonesiensis]GEN04190.1 hypothetical protein AIN02nite_22150 [Acetobacter indonesiensis]
MPFHHILLDDALIRQWAMTANYSASMMLLIIVRNKKEVLSFHKRQDVLHPGYNSAHRRTKLW